MKVELRIFIIAPYELVGGFFMGATQLDLFAEYRAGKLARRTDPETSTTAAVALVNSGRLRGQMGDCYDLVCKYPGRTSAELAALSEFGIQSRFILARRLPDLQRAGLVRKGGKRICRQHGTEAVTWFST